MRYVVPAAATKEIRLWRPVASSFDATTVRAPTDPPVYAASSVSKPLPAVSIVTVAVFGAVHANQIDLPPALPAWFGSPASLVAPIVVADVVPLPPAIVLAAASASFATPGDETARLQFSVTVPDAPP